MKTVILAASLYLAATTAGAQPWAVADLGRVYKAAHCIQAARQAFRDLLGEVRIARLHASDWVAYADGINRTHDALISCTYGDNRGTRATLVIHSSGQPVNAQLLKRRIGELFEDHAARITRAWIERYE